MVLIMRYGSVFMVQFLVVLLASLAIWGIFSPHPIKKIKQILNEPVMNKNDFSPHPHTQKVKKSKQKTGGDWAVMVVTLKSSPLNILINMTLGEYKTYNCNFQMSCDLLLTSSKTSFLTSL